MKSTDLAYQVEMYVQEAQRRIQGPGHAQYALGDKQKFESMSREELVLYLREELLDQINYSVMMLIRLDQLEEGLQWL